jgi:membrane protease YdiL (CAAX protease family)
MSPHVPSKPECAGKNSPALEGLRKTVVATAVTTAVVTLASYLAPRAHAASFVGMGFLGAVWILVLRKDAETIRAFGLSLGGLLEPDRIDFGRLARAALIAACWAFLAILVTFPAFWLGYWVYFQPKAHFVLRWPAGILDEVAGQIAVIALPEEAFFRGYLQTSLDRAFPPKWRVLGANLGPSWLLTASVFAVGHVLTDLHAARLAVFFPALLFGWLRQRARGIGAPVLFHAACNLFSATLARSYEGG